MNLLHIEDDHAFYQMNNLVIQIQCIVTRHKKCTLYSIFYSDLFIERNIFDCILHYANIRGMGHWKIMNFHIQSLKRCTFPFFLAFTVCSQCVNRSFTVRSLALSAPFELTFTNCLSCVHLALTVRSAFIYRSVSQINSMRNFKVKGSVSASQSKTRAS